MGKRLSFIGPIQFRDLLRNHDPNDMFKRGSAIIAPDRERDFFPMVRGAPRTSDRVSSPVVGVSAFLGVADGIKKRPLRIKHEGSRTANGAMT